MALAALRHTLVGLPPHMHSGGRRRSPSWDDSPTFSSTGRQCWALMPRAGFVDGDALHGFVINVGKLKAARGWQLDVVERFPSSISSMTPAISPLEAPICEPQIVPNRTRRGKGRWLAPRYLPFDFDPLSYIEKQKRML